MTAAAFFDFDGTLIDGYSAKAVLRERVRKADLGIGEAAQMAVLAGRSALGADVLAEFMAVGVRGLRGKPVAELEAFGERLTRKVLGGQLFPEAAALVRKHRRAGRRVVIATSALPFQVMPLARELGVDDVLCTRLEVKDDVCTGEIDGEILWDEGKAAAVRDYAAERGIDLAASFAYGNGDEDVAFLGTVGHPVAVNPGSRLAAVAAERQWPVERFTPRPSGSLIAAPRTLAAYAGLAAGCTVGAGLGVLNRSRRVASDLAFSLGSEVGLSLAGIRIDVQGEENLWAERPAVFIFNHQSLLDGWVAINLVRSNFTGIAKKEMGRVPVLAQFAWLTDIALIDRKDSASARASLEKVVEKLRDGSSVVLAPEGTRSVTPTVGPFKKGAFHLARQAGIPVVPIVIRNAGDLQWRGSKVMHSGVLEVKVLEPVDVTAWAEDELGERVAEIRQLFVDTLDAWC